MNPRTAARLLGLLRHLITTAGGYRAANPEFVHPFAATLVIAAGMYWSVHNKGTPIEEGPLAEPDDSGADRP